MEKSKHMDTAKRLADTEKYDYVEYVTRWNNNDVYFACLKELLDTNYGYPTYILVDINNKARFAEYQEIEDIIKSLHE